MSSSSPPSFPAAGAAIRGYPLMLLSLLLVLTGAMSTVDGGGGVIDDEVLQRQEEETLQVQAHPRRRHTEEEREALRRQHEVERMQRAATEQAAVAAQKREVHKGDFQAKMGTPKTPHRTPADALTLPDARTQCAWKHQASGAVYNLCPLVLGGDSAFVFRDSVGDAEHDSHVADLIQKADSERAAAEARALRASLNSPRKFVMMGPETSDGDDDEPESAGVPKPVRAAPVRPGQHQTLGEEDYDYWINVARNVRKLPSDSCRGTLPGGDEDAFAPAYQVVLSSVDQEGNKLKRPVILDCFALGSLKNASYSLIDKSNPDVGVALTYYGGEQCMKKVMVPRGNSDETASTSTSTTSTAAETADISEKEARATRRQPKYIPAWVSVPRQITLNMRCDESDAGFSHDPSYVMTMSRRVMIVETSMCEYTVEWPTKNGCPLQQTNGPNMLGMQYFYSVYIRGRWPQVALLLFVALAFIIQMYRHNRAMTLLLPQLMQGDLRSWSAFARLLFQIRFSRADNGSKRVHFGNNFDNYYDQYHGKRAY